MRSLMMALSVMSLVFVVGGSAGCGKKKKKKGHKVLKQVKAFRNVACSCKKIDDAKAQKDCLKKATKKLSDIDMGKKVHKKYRKKIERAFDEGGKCMKKTRKKIKERKLKKMLKKLKK